MHRRGAAGLRAGRQAHIQDLLFLSVHPFRGQWRRRALQPWKSVFGVFGAVVPVVYCGGLICYFLDTSGSMENAKTVGLGPTLLGLAIVGLLFCIPLLLKLSWLFVQTRPPRAGGPPNNDGDGGFDADAVVARYLARGSADGSRPATGGAPRTGGGTARRPGFGRKSG